MVVNRKIVLPAFLITGIVLVLIYLQAVVAWKAVEAAKNEYDLNQEKQSSPCWYHSEGNQMKKNILWFEQQLILSKSDSIYLAVDLRENLVMLGLKGKTLLESKILDQYPSDFFAVVSEKTYNQFAVASVVVNESANFPKKDIRKVIALKISEYDSEIQNDVNASKPLRWTITTENNFRIIITGIQLSDDSSIVVNPIHDIIIYRLKEIAQHPVSGKYTPSVYLWLNDKDAKTIYRAVSSKGKILLRS